MKSGDWLLFLKMTLLTLLCFLIGNTTVSAQDYLFDTEVIGVEDGLPHRNTYDIVQDKEGFMWVSTLGGISRYDGYNFKTYNASFLNILESSGARLAVDAENYLWYREGGVKGKPPNSGVINTRLDTIYTITAFSKGLIADNTVRYIGNSETNPDDVFIITQPGIVYKYNGSFEEIYRLPALTSDKTAVRCQAGPDGSYWIVYGNNVINVKDKKRLKTVYLDQAHHIAKIISVYPDLIVKAHNTFAIQYLILENDRFVPFSLKNYAPQEITGLFSLHKDYSCYFVEDTLLICDSRGNIIYRFNDFGVTGSRGYLAVETTFTDRQNTFWLATGNGIVKVSAKKNPFTTLESKSSVRGIYREGNQLWIGNPRNNTVKNMTDGSEKKIENLVPGTAAMSFYKDDKDQLWIGTGGHKILKYLPGTDSYIPYTFTHFHGFQLPFQNTVTKNHWIGTEKGMYRFNPTNKTVTPFPLPVPSGELYIRQLYQNTKGIWIVSNKGIFLMDGEKETLIKHYTTADGLPGDNMNHIYEEKENIFWLGTKGDGLVRWNLAENSFRQYTRRDGLSNNNIYAVYEDDFETLWLPSDYGLMEFDKNTATTKVYLPQNGIAHEEFNTHSHFQAEDGTLYFGGLNGVTSFHPAALREEYKTAPPLYLNKVRILEKDTEEFTDNTADYLNTKTISLSATDRILALDLTLLDYEKSTENLYAYKIEDHQEQWIYTTDNKLSIINPPYGTYNLIIKARGASGSWSTDMLTIPVYKSPPFYLQWWFIITSVLSIAVIVIAAFRWRIQKLQKDRKQLEAEVRKRTYQIEQDKIIIEKDKQVIETQAKALKVLDKAKTRFFSNITHEFRTPLTLIAGPVEQMIAKKPPAYFKKGLNGVLKNAHNLLGLINQLLDLSKLEGRQMKIEVSHGDIIRYTKELVQRFQPLADKKELHLEFQSQCNTWKTHFDSDKWNKIFHNLLSNAIKFTPEGGHITVSLQQLQEAQQEYMQLKITDTGIGIAAENLEHIFNRFYQADGSTTRAHEGTGIGLSLVQELAELQNGTITVTSTPGKGTTFTVKLPVITGIAAKTAPPLALEESRSLPTPIQTWAENGETIVNDPGTAEKLQLLIIEDNAEMRTYIRSCLDASTYHISEAANGQEGIEKAQEIVPDLIISDVMMPEKDGFEVTEAIRNHIATSHIPLILLTAKAALESRLKGLERGADAYLTKPFSPQELALRIKKLIELRRLLQARYQDGQLPEENAAFEKEDAFISKLKTYITENISDSKLNADHISRHFAMSRMQLHRKLKSLINNTTGKYIRAVRLTTALQLLKEKELTIAEIAYETGFMSPGAFSKIFKKTYGKTPSEVYYNK